MGILSRRREKRAWGEREEEIFNRSALSLGGGVPASSGIDVSEETASRMTAVYACVRVISETVGSLPFHIYKRLPGGGREKAQDHPVYPVLHDQPNDYQVAITFWETLSAHICLWGNAYARIIYDKNGSQAGVTKALVPIHPTMVKLGKSGEWYYVKNDEGGEDKIPYYGILHIPGLGYDGRLGKSPIAMAREAIGLGLAAEKFGSKFFANNARPGMALQHPGALSDDAYDRLKKSWSEAYGGLDNAHKPAILEEGLSVATFGVPPQDAQYLELRKFQVEEIARLYRVPPHMIGHTAPSTTWGSGIEQMSIGFAVYTIRPWLVRIEQAVKARLLVVSDLEDYYPEFALDGLLRGDAGQRAAFYKELFYMGAINQNEIREKENFNPIEGGDRYYIPLNLVPIERMLEEPAPPEPPPEPPLEEPEEEPEEDQEEDRGRPERRSAALRRNVRESYKRVFRESMTRVLRGERRNVLRAVKEKDPRVLESWLQMYYKNENPAFVERTMGGVFHSLAEAIYPLAAEQVGVGLEMTPDVQECVKIHVEKFAWRQSQQSLNRLLEVLKTGGARSLRQDEDEEDPDEEDLYGAMEEEFNSFEESRPDAVAEWEATRVDGMVAKAVFVLAGITTLVWVANSGCCEYCAAMDGAVVGVSETFVSADGGVEVEGSDTLSPSWNVVSPPLHDHCNCSIEPGD